MSECAYSYLYEKALQPMLNESWDDAYVYALLAKGPNAIDSQTVLQLIVYFTSAYDTEITHWTNFPEYVKKLEQADFDALIEAGIIGHEPDNSQSSALIDELTVPDLRVSQ